MSLQEYVESHQGRRVISKILIANNGIAALKAIRSIKKWCYDMLGDDKAIQFVAMATPSDIKVNAAYIHLADEFVEVPDGPNNNNYANVMLITELAERTGAQAVWAGWGHASENPKLPDSLNATRNKIIWIGPPPSAMRALGDKIGSTLIAQSAGVACMPWSGSGLTVDYRKTGIPTDIYEQSCVKTVEQCVAAVEKIGYPVMIKASEGGGGKGIRMVSQFKDLALSFQQVQGEVPGSPIFLMKLAHNCRHLEVQLLADEYGEAIAIFGRDCSVQRRHQKIIEEGPVVAAPKDMWRKMERAAVALAKEVGYTCAGTVEYLYMEDQNDYCFLELNPRLQVEHPVTELISGVNLPAAQLQVSMGIPMHRISGIRRMFGENEDESSPIDFDNTPAQPLPGHVIACRVTAENPEEMFQPTSGHILELNFRSTPDVWGYFSVSGGGGVHEYSDSQFGHMFATGRNRDQARRSMVLALKELSIRGDIRTTVEYLRQLLETPDFKNNHLSTSWLDALMKQKLGVPMIRPPPHLAACLGAVFRAHKHSVETLTNYISCLERGQFPPKSLHDDLVSSNQVLIYEDVKYCFTVHESGPGLFTLVYGHWTAASEVITLADGGLLVLLNGKKFVVYGKEFPSGLRLTLEGCTLSFTEEYDPTVVKSNMAGKLIRYLVPDNSHIDKGEALAEVEVMKMFLTLPAPEAGYVKLLKPPGAIINPGELLASMRLDNPGAVKKATLFTDSLPDFKPPHPEPRNVSIALRQDLKPLQMLLNGYRLGPGLMQAALDKVLTALRDPMLPMAEFQTVISSLAGRLSEHLYDTLSKLAELYAQRSTHKFYWEKPQPFPVQDMIQAIDDASSKLDPAQQAVLEAHVTPLRIMLKQYSDGNHTRAVEVITELLETFYKIEILFAGEHLPEFVIGELRKEKKDDLHHVVQVARAHHQLQERKELTKALLEVVNSQFEPMTNSFLPILHKLCRLGKPAYSGVVLKARQVLIKHDLPSSQERLLAVQTLLSATSLESQSSPSKRLARLDPLVNQSQPIEDLIFSFLDSRQHRCEAMEVYIRRSYHMYRLSEVHVQAKGSDMLLATWEFALPVHNPKEKGSNIMTSRNYSVGDLTMMAGQEKSPVPTPNKNTVIMEGNEGSKKKKKKTSSKKKGKKSRESSELDMLEAPTNTLCEVKRGLSGGSEFRQAAMAFCGDLEALKKHLMTILSHFTAGTERVLYLGFQWRTTLTTDDVLSQYLQTFVQSNKEHLEKALIRRVTFIVLRNFRTVEYPRIFTYRAKFGLEEDRVIRHVEPAMALHLQLERLSCFRFQHVDSANRNVHLFQANPEPKVKPDRTGYDGRRFFVRTILRKLEPLPQFEDQLDLAAHPETEYAVVQALNSLEIAIGSAHGKYRFNHLFFNVLSETSLTVQQLEDIIWRLARRYGDKMLRLCVMEAEFDVRVKDEDSDYTIAYRFVCRNETGVSLEVERYAAREDNILKYEGPKPFHEAVWHGKTILEPTPVFHPLDPKRQSAQALDTIYCYDFLTVIEKTLRKIWREHGADRPEKLMEAVELVIDRDVKMDPLFRTGKLKEKKVVPGSNDIGMVAWRVTLFLPECAETGRDVVFIANDITFLAGTFGVQEDLMFFLASQYARQHGLPRIYLSANSGARIGLAREVMDKFQVAWIDNDPLKGPEYLYLSPTDYESLKDVVQCKEIKTSTGKEYVIQTIVGRGESLSVENLSGSGLIAGETSKAYDDVYTLTYVTARSVGIGAYLARLGQRIIQKSSQPLLLTGYNALNKLLGKQVYTSNQQLGGPDIMFNNGVSHLVVSDDLAGVQAILKWLRYVPNMRKGAPTCYLPLKPDPIERVVAWRPTKSPYDPRHMLAGALHDPTAIESNEEGEMSQWVSGFFDKGSWMELLRNWAQSVVVGRARLGGLPMGVIAVETRSFDMVVPADPAAPTSKEQVVAKAGMVWYPDSAYKTSQAINDMAAEDLPIMIFANWRGFSGGMTDMFNQVLKFGSYIVDSLRGYKQPVFVYLPPEAMVRGGAWVVIDSTINSKYMEMYAAPEARGGVLEPEGTVAVAYPAKIQVLTQNRLDPVLMDLAKKLKNSKEGSGKQAIEGEIKAREKSLASAYHQAAGIFCDLHDTPGRMIAKGVIRDIVPWETSRSYFYWRLQRRTIELSYSQKIEAALGVEDQPDGWMKALDTLHSWVKEQGAGKLLDNDRHFFEWANKNSGMLVGKVQELTHNGLVQKVSHMIKHLTGAERTAMLKALTVHQD
eukprot:gb/GEZN01000115.1/.p1 GENE.gb/GEZN01000115.1/~~gb/GEZN01000115.1/.p1  ORF type:complete len:2290 (+),score=335.54 gb/GEZN01000115.1/:133-6870(+)